MGRSFAATAWRLPNTSFSGKKATTILSGFDWNQTCFKYVDVSALSTAFILTVSRQLRRGVKVVSCCKCAEAICSQPGDRRSNLPTRRKTLLSQHSAAFVFENRVISACSFRFGFSLLFCLTSELHSQLASRSGPSWTTLGHLRYQEGAGRDRADKYHDRGLAGRSHGLADESLLNSNAGEGRLGKGKNLCPAFKLLIVLEDFCRSWKIFLLYVRT